MKYIKKINESKNPQRYFFTQDDDSHWYMIPLELKDEWDSMRNIENAWKLDEWQKFEDLRLSGGINFSFENPKEL